MKADGFEALRIEDVAKQAGVAKGTFFAHFKDKDALMDLLIGERFDASLDNLEKVVYVEDVAALTDELMPILNVMASEQYVFEVVMRLSGALANEPVGSIANALYRQDRILAKLIARSPFRKDVSPDLLAEGVLAFETNALSLSFCELHRNQGIRERLEAYLFAWLAPYSRL